MEMPQPPNETLQVVENGSRSNNEEPSALMRAPPEVRLMIYEYLYQDAGQKTLSIRNAPRGRLPKDDAIRQRTRYHVLDRCFHRRCYETTYRLDTDDVSFCVPLMCANGTIYEETSHLIYSRHTFDFGTSIEAIEPFLSDLSPPNRARIQELALYKRGPVPLYENDRSEWRSLCVFLQQLKTVRRLRLTVQGGRPSPNVIWDGPRELSASDFKLLASLKHESLDWVADLSQVEGIEDLEILPDIQYCPPPTSTSMIVFAAFSASIERGLAEFLRAQLRLG